MTKTFSPGNYSYLLQDPLKCAKTAAIRSCIEWIKEKNEL